MNDGGVVQIAYVFRDSEIERHRLAYYPCPFPIEKDELQAFGGGLVDFISEVPLTRMEETLQLCSPVRFDYAPEAIGDFHPASHVTINTSTCRIPARSPLQFDTFIKFIFENFYLDAWQHPKVARSFAFKLETETLSAHDKGRAYLNWTYE
jgi:hypothetical protein